MHNLQPRVTVIVPVYNNQEDIIAAIKSIIGQSCRCWEIIVVDDFSDDGSYEVVKDFIRRNSSLPIKCIRNERNCGTYVSINNGILASAGKYLTVVGSDDIIHPRKLEMQVGILDGDSSHIFSGVDHWVVRSGQLISQEASLMVRKSLVSKIGFYDSVRFAADTEFRNRVRLVGPIVTIGQPLYFAKRRINSLTTASSTGSQFVRRAYVAEFTEWHRRAKSPFMNYPIAEADRPFAVHQSMLP